MKAREAQWREREAMKEMDALASSMSSSALEEALAERSTSLVVRVPDASLPVTRGAKKKKKHRNPPGPSRPRGKLSSLWTRGPPKRKAPPLRGASQPRGASKPRGRAVEPLYDDSSPLSAWRATSDDEHLKPYAPRPAPSTPASAPPGAAYSGRHRPAGPSSADGAIGASMRRKQLATRSLSEADRSTLCLYARDAWTLPAPAWSKSNRSLPATRLPSSGSAFRQSRTVGSVHAKSKLQNWPF